MGRGVAGRRGSQTPPGGRKFGRITLPTLPTAVHIGAMLFSGAPAFFGPSLPHRLKRLWKKKKSARTSMLLRGNTTPTTPPCPSAPPPPPPLLLLLLLLLFYNIKLHYCTSTAIKPLHLVSSPEPFGRCDAARQKWRGERPTDERNFRIKALLFVSET